MLPDGRGLLYSAVGRGPASGGASAAEKTALQARRDPGGTGAGDPAEESDRL